MASAACDSKAFVTLLSSSRFLPGALCLPRQMARVQSVCPLYLVLDDGTWASMSRTERSGLLEAYGGRKHIFMLSTLLSEAGYPPSSLASAAAIPVVTPLFGSDKRSSPPVPPSTSWSELVRIAAQTLKLWLYALPASRFRRVAFLDLDMLITRNVDALLLADTQRQLLASVPAANCTPHGVPVFNSGVLVFSPSLRTLSALLTRLRFSMAPWLGAMPLTADEPTAANVWPAWVDLCAPVAPLFGGNASPAGATDGLSDCFLPSCLRAARLFPRARSPLSACRVHYGGRLAFRQRAFADAVCEPKMTDQSILNWHVWCYEAVRWKTCKPLSLSPAQGGGAVGWQPLPLEYNTKWNGHVHGPALKKCVPAAGTTAHRQWRRHIATVPAILHFHGPNKPWAKTLRGVSMAGKVWSRWCEASQCVPETFDFVDGDLRRQRA